MKARGWVTKMRPLAVRYTLRQFKILKSPNVAAMQRTQFGFEFRMKYLTFDDQVLGFHGWESMDIIPKEAIEQ